MLNRISIIQNLIDKNGYTDYLEVGVQAGDCFNAIRCENKVGVDPDKSSAATVHLTSDEFFELNEAKYDIIFLDGLHISEQLDKDIENSLNCLKKGGTIILHDCLPTNEYVQMVPHTTQDEWTGDCWKSFVKLRMEREDLSLHTVNTDWGCAIIQRGHNELLKVNVPIDYHGFVAFKNDWMNVISEQQFIEMYL